MRLILTKDWNEFAFTPPFPKEDFYEIFEKNFFSGLKYGKIAIYLTLDGRWVYGKLPIYTPDMKNWNGEIKKRYEVDLKEIISRVEDKEVKKLILTLYDFWNNEYSLRKELENRFRAVLEEKVEADLSANAMTTYAEKATYSLAETISKFSEFINALASERIKKEELNIERVGKTALAEATWKLFKDALEKIKEVAPTAEEELRRRITSELIEVAEYLSKAKGGEVAPKAGE
jgi:hypothetical protein